MSAFSNVVLNNHALTAVTFAPADINPQTKVARWLAPGASLDVRPSLTMSVTYPSGNGSRVRVKGKVSNPMINTDDVLTRDDEVIATFELSLPKSASLLERQDLLAFVRGMIDSSIVTSAVEDYESIY